jgi:hypothetical protein
VSRIIDTVEFETILATFEGPELVDAVASARRLSRMEGVSLTKSSVVPTSHLRAIYARRALDPRRQMVASQCSRIAEIAARFPEERWHLIIVRVGDELQVTLFSNESGRGRAAIDFTNQSE